MDNGRLNYSVFLGAAILCLFLCACSDGTPWRYNPGLPDNPAGITAISGNGQISLNWSPATGAAAYNIYYATSPGVTISTANKVPNITGTSTIVTGLTNDVTYYFAISAVNSSGESQLSGQVAIAPSLPGSYQQSDLQGDWQFNALVSGTGAKWMRGSISIDGEGNVAFTSFLDSSGNATPPLNLFTTMSVLSDGTVIQAGVESGFQGTLSANQFKDTLVATASTGAASQLIAILQKQVPGITFTNSDIQGTGKLAGPLTFVYHQLSSGSNQEWEYAACQAGQDQSVMYASINAPTIRELPGGGSKVTTLAITSDGIVTETPISGVLPQPTALLNHGVMSADKMMIVGTMTDVNGFFVLRVIHMIHPPSVALTSSNYSMSALSGSYILHTLINGTNPLWAYGTLAIDSTGVVTFPSYLNSNSDSTSPVGFMLSVSALGALTNPADSTYNGKFSYYGDMIVSTRTDVTGGYAFDIALKR